MIGLCTFAVGFEEETDRDYWRLFRHAFAPMIRTRSCRVYATPHRWTPFFEASKHRRILRDDLRQWDYKHQVLETPHVPAWRVFVWVKLIEMVLQLRPRALWRVFLHPDPEIRHAMRWYTRMGRRVVLRELWGFLRQRTRPGATVAAFLRAEVQTEENALSRARRPGALELAPSKHGLPRAEPHHMLVEVKPKSVQ